MIVSLFCCSLELSQPERQSQQPWRAARSSASVKGFSRFFNNKQCQKQASSGLQCLHGLLTAEAACSWSLSFLPRSSESAEQPRSREEGFTSSLSLLWNSFFLSRSLIADLTLLLASQHHCSSGSAQGGGWGGGGDRCLGKCRYGPGLLGLSDGAILEQSGLQEDSDETQQDTGGLKMLLPKKKKPEKIKTLVEFLVCFLMQQWINQRSFGSFPPCFRSAFCSSVYSNKFVKGFYNKLRFTDPSEL